MPGQRRPFDVSFSDFALPEDEYHHVQYEEHAEVRCAHNLEFWVAVRTVRRDGAPMVIQWCMRCQTAETLTWEEYRARRISRQEHEYNDIENYRDTEL